MTMLPWKSLSVEKMLVILLTSLKLLSIRVQASSLRNDRNHNNNSPLELLLKKVASLEAMIHQLQQDHLELDTKFRALETNHRSLQEDLQDGQGCTFLYSDKDKACIAASPVQFDNPVTFVDDVQLDGKFTVTSQTTFEETVDYKKPVVFEGEATFQQPVTFEGIMNFPKNDDLIFETTVWFDQPTNFREVATFTADVTMQGPTAVNPRRGDPRSRRLPPKKQKSPLLHIEGDVGVFLDTTEPFVVRPPTFHENDVLMRQFGNADNPQNVFPKMDKRNVFANNNNNNNPTTMLPPKLFMSGDLVAVNGTLNIAATNVNVQADLSVSGCTTSSYVVTTGMIAYGDDADMIACSENFDLMDGICSWYLHPSASPSEQPSSLPSASAVPSINPSQAPSTLPSEQPSKAPSASASPSVLPSAFPSGEPSLSSKPSHLPSRIPSMLPSSNPSNSQQPSISPSLEPTKMKKNKADKNKKK